MPQLCSATPEALSVSPQAISPVEGSNTDVVYSPCLMSMMSCLPGCSSAAVFAHNWTGSRTRYIHKTVIKSATRQTTGVGSVTNIFARHGQSSMARSAATSAHARPLLWRSPLANVSPELPTLCFHAHVSIGSFAHPFGSNRLYVNRNKMCYTVSIRLSPSAPLLVGLCRVCSGHLTQVVLVAPEERMPLVLCSASIGVTALPPNGRSLPSNPTNSMTEGLYRHDVSHTRTNLYVLLNVTLRAC